MASIGEKIRNARKDSGMTQTELAQKTSLSRSYIGDIEKDRYNPSVATLQAIAKATDVPVESLLGGTPPAAPAQPPAQKATKEQGVRIPVLGRVVAGIPIEAIEEVIDWEEIPQKMASTGKFFALRVCGHSMEPKILEGDVVIVRQQDDVDNGDIAIVLVNGDEATVKRIKKQAEGITLIATNISVYEPHFYSNQEIRDLPVRVIGKVVELRRKL